MVDSPTTRNRLRKQELGTNTNAWGDPKLNEVLDSIDQSMDGYLAIALTGDITLTTTNYSTADQAKRRVLKFTGTLSASANVIVPSVEHEYAIINAAGADVVIKTFAGVGVTIPTGYQARVYCDANDVFNGSPTLLPGAVTVAGQIHAVTAGTSATDAVNKDQMETAIANAALPASAGTVRISSNDTTAGYLGQKQSSARANAAYAIANGGGNESSQITIQDLALIDGGLAAASFSPNVGTAYRVPSGGTITLPTPTGSGRKIVLAIGGAGFSTLSGIVSSGGAIRSSLLIPGDQTLTLTDYDGTRGWV